MIRSQRAVEIVLYEVFEEEQDAIRAAWPDAPPLEFCPGTIQEENHAAPPAPVISIRTQSIIPQDWLPALQAILTRSTGYDHLIPYRNSTLQLGYLPDYCARSVAEHAFLLWTALLKKLPAQMDSFNNFNRSGITGSELLDKKLLVIGVGRIGVQIARLASAVGMRVHGLDPDRKHADIEYVDTGTRLSAYDIIVCAMNLTEDNHAYFNREFFDRVKGGCIFVNIARGEMSPHEVLLENLRTGKLGGVGLDVFDNESELVTQLRHKTWINDDTEILLEMETMPNVILTPHNAFNTREATGRKAQQTVQQLQECREQRRFVWTI